MDMMETGNSIDVAWVAFFWSILILILYLIFYFLKPFGEITHLQYFLLALALFSLVAAIYSLYVRR